MNNTISKILNGTIQVTPIADLEKKIATGKPLVLKFGIDPTSTDLHLGHAVVLSKIKQLQDMGHTIIFLIGDFTARIGDPTGKSKTRPPLSKEQIQENLKTYIDQVGRILDRNKITITFNSQWLDPLRADDMIRLCSMVTVARIIERDDFQKRLQAGAPIALHELLYPLVQAYDSVALNADIEIGGTDQLFNMLMGRFLQEQYGKPAQVVITMPLLEGLDGVNKMSKSLNNYVGLTEDPAIAYGKLMSISDELMWRYYSILVGLPDNEIATMKTIGHPKEHKKNMAYRIIERFWSKNDAQKAQENFEALFERRDYSQAQKVPLPTNSPIWIIDLLKHIGAITTSSEARRLIESNAVGIDGKIVQDFKAQITPSTGMTIKVGKHRIYQFE